MGILDTPGVSRAALQALQQQLEELEQAGGAAGEGGGFPFKGEWTAQAYAAGDVVRRGTTLYAAPADIPAPTAYVPTRRTFQAETVSTGGGLSVLNASRPDGTPYSYAQVPGHGGTPPAFVTANIGGHTVEWRNGHSGNILKLDYFELEGTALRVYGVPSGNGVSLMDIRVDGGALLEDRLMPVAGDIPVHVPYLIYTATVTDLEAGGDGFDATKWTLVVDVPTASDSAVVRTTKVFSAALPPVNFRGAFVRAGGNAIQAVIVSGKDQTNQVIEISGVATVPAGANGGQTLVFGQGDVASGGLTGYYNIPTSVVKVGDVIRVTGTYTSAKPLVYGPTAIVRLTDNQGNAIASYPLIDATDPGTLYAAGDAVSYNGLFYKALQATDSRTAPAAPNWEQYLIPTHTVGLVELGAEYRVLALQATAACRVRLYDTAASRTADLERAAGTAITLTSGVMLDVVLPTTDLITLRPVPGWLPSGTQVPIAVSPTTTTGGPTSPEAALSVTLTYSG